MRLFYTVRLEAPGFRRTYVSRPSNMSLLDFCGDLGPAGKASRSRWFQAYSVSTAKSLHGPNLHGNPRSCQASARTKPIPT